MRKRITVLEEHILTQEELLVKAWKYAQENKDESYVEVCKRNDLLPTKFYNWMNRIGCHWKKREKSKEIGKQLEFCKNNQNKTLHEICEENDWDYGCLLAALNIRGYYHPNAKSIKSFRKAKQITQLLKEGFNQYTISKKLHTSNYFVTKVRESLGLPNQKEVTKQKIKDIKIALEQKISDSKITRMCHVSDNTVKKIREGYYEKKNHSTS